MISRNKRASLWGNYPSNLLCFFYCTGKSCYWLLFFSLCFADAWYWVSWEFEQQFRGPCLGTEDFQPVCGAKVVKQRLQLLAPSSARVSCVFRALHLPQTPGSDCKWGITAYPGYGEKCSFSGQVFLVWMSQEASVALIRAVLTELIPGKPV